MKSNILVVTSFSTVGYRQYGAEFIKSFHKYWPKEVDLKLYIHKPYPVKDDAVKEEALIQGELEANGEVYFNLDTANETLELKDGFSNLVATHGYNHISNDKGVVNWRFDVPKFVNKVLALGHVNQNHMGNYEWVIWLDADTITKKEVTKEFLAGLLDEKADVIRLGRNGVTAYSETSFIAFRNNERARTLIEKLAATYLLHEYRFYSEWHDGFVFERLLNLSILGDKLSAKNLTPGVTDLDAFGVSPLAPYMEHLKGNKKEGGMISTATVLPKTNAIKSKSTVPGKTPSPYGGFVEDTVRYNPLATPITVVANDSVSNTVLEDNIKENMGLIQEWVEECKQVKGSKVIIVGGGPSASIYYDRIKEDVAKGAYVCCVKHAYPLLLSNGITPDFVVALDPRDIEGESTIGVVRKNLYAVGKPSDKTVFLLASMTSPSVTKFLLESGRRVVGWHSHSGETTKMCEEGVIPSPLHSIVGGSCSVMRSLGLMGFLGFTDLVITGIDASFQSITPEEEATILPDGRRKFYRVWLPPGVDYKLQVLPPDGDVQEGLTPIGGRYYWSTGEFIVLYQEVITLLRMFQQMNKAHNTGVTLDCWFDEKKSLVGEGWRRAQLEDKTKEKERRMNDEEREKKQSVEELFGWN